MKKADLNSFIFQLYGNDNAQDQITKNGKTVVLKLKMS